MKAPLLTRTKHCSENDNACNEMKPLHVNEMMEMRKERSKLLSAVVGKAFKSMLIHLL